MVTTRILRLSYALAILTCVVLYRCQREAAWAITNMTLEASTPQLGSLLGAGALKPYLALLDGPDTRTTLVVLDGLANLLKV